MNSNPKLVRDLITIETQEIINIIIDVYDEKIITEHPRSVSGEPE